MVNITVNVEVSSYCLPFPYIKLMLLNSFVLSKIPNVGIIHETTFTIRVAVNALRAINFPWPYTSLDKIFIVLLKYFCIGLSLLTFSRVR